MPVRETLGRETARSSSLEAASTMPTALQGVALMRVAWESALLRLLSSKMGRMDVALLIQILRGPLLLLRLRLRGRDSEGKNRVDGSVQLA